MIYFVLFVGFVVVAPLAILMAFAIWAASGEGDVNGDPERDSGRTEDDIEEMFRTWDRGSCQTELRPNLEYARWRNRRALRRASGL